jgi:pimeloyl-ACP methyl ester carboxylesterase
MHPLIILHGWSDTSDSFKPLAKWLRAQGFEILDLFLGDYLSMNDEITLFDIGNAFRLALERNKIPQTRHSFNLIVHSTGGLVAREYLRQVCKDSEGRPDATRSPIEHLCMLAPANFGSPLAKIGKSVIGRLFKGWDWNHFAETGKHVLDALELGAPYSFQLALDDLFDPAFPIFSPANTFTTVIVGSHPYADALRSTIHENGTDGTVRVATANLNANCFVVDFETATGTPILVARPRNVSRIAFAVLHRNHGSIIDPIEPANKDEWAKTVLDALTLPAAQYDLHADRCAVLAARTFEEGKSAENPLWYHQYQHIVFRVHDQFGASILDYMVEFYQEHGDEHDRVFKYINSEVIEKVTANDVDSGYRSFLMDVTDLMSFLDSHSGDAICMSISAAHLSRRIRFRNPERGIEVFTHDDGRFRHPNEPILVDITLHRDPNIDSDDKALNVFRLGRAS